MATAHVQVHFTPERPPTFATSVRIHSLVVKQGTGGRAQRV